MHPLWFQSDALFPFRVHGLARTGARFLSNEAKHFWLRHECKPAERRTALLPEHARALIDAGFRVTVEHSPSRCVPDSEYEKVGCELAPTNAWHDAPLSAIILGLKEVTCDKSTEPMKRRHVYFSHSFKNQRGWKDILCRFGRGQGMLWDLEFLTDDNGRRVAAFGRSAGFVGMGVGILAWAHQLQEPSKPLGPLPVCNSFDDLVTHVRSQSGLENRVPSVAVIGALGRVGSGAIACAKACGVPEEKMLLWDYLDTRSGGPFPQLLQQDIVVNCINLQGAVSPFLSMDMIDPQPPEKPRTLRVVVDVSCDFTNPDNPFPIYSEGSSFEDPTIRLETQDPPLDVVAIDHLPSLVPYDSSREFGDQILPHLLAFPESAVWDRAYELFKNKLAEAACQVSAPSE